MASEPIAVFVLDLLGIVVPFSKIHFHKVLKDLAEQVVVA